LIEQDRTVEHTDIRATTLPKVSLAMSPGTSSAAGKVVHAPSRSTDAFSASRDFNAAIVDCARLS
jgi:hypothetical protein